MCLIASNGTVYTLLSRIGCIDAIYGDAMPIWFWFDEAELSARKRVAAASGWNATTILIFTELFLEHSYMQLGRTLSLMMKLKFCT